MIVDDIAVGQSDPSRQTDSSPEVGFGEVTDQWDHRNPILVG